MGKRIHGLCKDRIRTKEYRAWQHMKRRCLTKTNPDYRHYGGRNIAVCDEWINDYSQFLNDMGEAPSPKHSLDRKDVNGNYTKDNCKWSTWSEQQNNKRNNVIITHEGETMNATQWSRRLGINALTIMGRVKKGYEPVKILSLQNLPNTR